MANFLGLSHYPTSDLIIMGIIFSISAAVIGYITDVVMGDSGFGPFGNGFLSVLGAVVAIHYRNFMLGPIASQETMMVGMSAAACATAMLLLLGGVKRLAR